MGDTTRFVEEISDALRKSARAETLIEIVQSHKANGLSQRAAYGALEHLWKELGFDDEEGEGNPIRDELEYVMELVWGFCPEGVGIWETSLSDSSRNLLR